MKYRAIPKKLLIEREDQLAAAVAWREAAKADGWTCEATYNLEPEETAFRMRKEGFQVQGLARPMNEEGRWPVGEISIWGPDGLAIRPPKEYDWERVKSGLRRCNYCDTEDVDTERVGFAGRCCKACLSEQRRKSEYPGWTR